MTRDLEIAAYNVKRDAAVLGSLAGFIRFSAAQGVRFSSPEVALIAQHKMRSAIQSMPAAVRRASIAWLETRGFTPWSDGRG